MTRGDGGAVPGGTETILVVDDDAAVRRAVRRLLEGRGYEVLEAEHAERALEILAPGGADVDLVLTDVIMPGMGGPQLATLIAKTRPRLPVVFMSGYPGDPTDWQRRGRGASAPAPLLHKPFTADQLDHAVRSALYGTN